MRQDFFVHACRFKKPQQPTRLRCDLASFLLTRIKDNLSRSTNQTTTTTNGDELWEAIAVCRRKHFEDCIADQFKMVS
jgi:hypothetical protein